MPVRPILVLWVLFIVWMLITTLFAFNTDWAFFQFTKVMKIQLLTFITIMLIRNKEQLDVLIWVIVGSIGFYSIKGGVFTILTAGNSRVWGPPGGFIEENNSLALATLMVIPLMIYLYKTSRRNIVKLALSGAIVLSIISAIGSQSRGALVSIVVVAGFFWLKSRQKLLSGIAILVFAVAGWSFMPQSWHDRMDTISNYEEDGSAMGRINAWYYSFNLANDRFTGGGFESWSPETFRIYAPNPDNWAAAHSIFFGVLGDHGWPGLLLFLMILYLTWRSLSKIIRLKTSDGTQGENQFLARMIQVSFIAYCSGGAFLSLSYFDLPWHLIAITYILHHRLMLEPDTAKTDFLKPKSPKFSGFQ